MSTLKPVNEIVAVLCTDDPNRLGLHLMVEPMYEIRALHKRTIEELVCGRRCHNPQATTEEVATTYINQVKSQANQELLQKAMEKAGWRWVANTMWWEKTTKSSTRWMDKLTPDQMQIKVVDQEAFDFMVGLAACDMATLVKLS